MMVRSNLIHLRSEGNALAPVGMSDARPDLLNLIHSDLDCTYDRKEETHE